MEKQYSELVRINGNKVVLALRIDAGYKWKLSEQAKSVGISLSELVESKLLKSDAPAQPVDDTKARELALQVANLNKQISELRQQLSVFNDSYLLELFDQLKGQQEIIEWRGKRYIFKYDTVQQLVNGIIYSFKINR